MMVIAYASTLFISINKKKKASLCLLLHGNMVPGTGLEPVRTFVCPRDFKSLASASSATPAKFGGDTRIRTGDGGFAVLCLTTWLCRRKWSGRRDSNPRPSPWQGDALPLSYSRMLMVPRGRIELPTRGFSVRCSTD